MLNENEIYNAQITSAKLGYNGRHFTATLWMDCNGELCEFGGRDFLNEHHDPYRRTPTAYGLEFIRQILDTLDVRDWMGLPGTYCRIKINRVTPIGYDIAYIGHITKDQWFSPRDIVNVREEYRWWCKACNMPDSHGQKPNLICQSCLDRIKQDEPDRDTHPTP